MEVNDKTDKVKKSALIIGVILAVLIACFAVYSFSYVAKPKAPMRVMLHFEVHLLVQHFDKYGNLISETYHPMTVTNYGKDWVEQQLFTDTNSTQNALWLAMSNDETAVDVAWVVLPNEITTAGLLRDDGAYVSTGVGAANVSLTFSITGTISTCLYGIYADNRTNCVGSLLAAEQQGSGARKNMVAGDSLKLTVQWSHS